MVLDFYYSPLSPPCRLVLLTAKALNLDLNLKLVDLQKGEHLTPEYIKLNPQHTIPTLVDDGFALAESRVICTYLISQYGKGSSLYPQEPKDRALVDQRLQFDLGCLYGRFADYLYPQVFGGTPADKGKLDKLNEGLGFLETFLTDEEYVAGESLTVADLSIVVTISSVEAIHSFDLNKFPNIQQWYKRVQASAPGYEETNGASSQEFKQVIQAMLNK